MSKPVARQNKPKAPAKPRISAKVRQALRYRVDKGWTWDQCAEAVKLSPSGLHKARLRPEVISEYDRLQREYVQGVDCDKARHKARAIEVAAAMLENDKDPVSQRFAVEFFAGESKKNPQVVVQTNVNSNGYAYLPPDAQVIDIKLPEDKRLINSQPDHDDKDE